jgi:thiol-disulfide isomerase/thioredoxin
MRPSLLALLILGAFTCTAQSGYKISFRINGLKDSTAYLANYYGESNNVRDTARIDAHGEVVFDGKKSLPQGMYMLALKEKGKAIRLFDVVVSSDQNFSMTTDTTDYVKNMRVGGDADNKLYYESLLFNFARNTEAQPLVKVVRDSTSTKEQKDVATRELNAVSEKVKQYQNKIILEHPATLTARILKAHRPVDIPDAPMKADGTPNQNFQLKWYREHFFDNFDLADDALIRMTQPIYQQKVNEYLDRLFVPHPDSIMQGIRSIVSKAQVNRETYKYVVYMCVIKYQQHEIMGLDEVYVNLVDEYFANGVMDFWVNASMKKNMKEAAGKMRVSLVGNVGDNLIMQDINKEPRSMYDLRSKYTLLFIFDPDCGHCKQETPKLVHWYEKRKFNLEVYAVALDSSMSKMRNYIKEMKMNWVTVNGPRSYVGPIQDHYECNQTPVLYILDDRKRIIAKKLPVERVEEFLTQHERIEKAKQLK